VHLESNDDDVGKYNACIKWAFHVHNVPLHHFCG